MRSLAAVAAIALVLAGCTGSSTAGESSPPVRHVAIAALPEEPAHDAPAVMNPSGPVDRSDPAAVAVDLIVAGLAEQDLEVVDVGVETLAANATAATVLLAATHRADTAGAEHTSVYELDLTRDLGGHWRLVGSRQAH